MVFHRNPLCFKHRPHSLAISGNNSFFLFFRGYFQKDFDIIYLFKIWVVAVGAFYNYNVIIWHGSDRRFSVRWCGCRKKSSMWNTEALSSFASLLASVVLPLPQQPSMAIRKGRFAVWFSFVLILFKISFMKGSSGGMVKRF